MIRLLVLWLALSGVLVVCVALAYACARLRDYLEDRMAERVADRLGDPEYPVRNG